MKKLFFVKKFKLENNRKIVVNFFVFFGGREQSWRRPVNNFLRFFFFFFVERTKKSTDRDLRIFFLELAEENCYFASAENSGLEDKRLGLQQILAQKVFKRKSGIWAKCLGSIFTSSFKAQKLFLKSHAIFFELVSYLFIYLFI